MVKRTISGAVLLAILGVVIYLLPPVAMLVLVSFMSVAASYEMLYRTGLEKSIQLNVYSAIMAVLVCVWSFYSGRFALMLAGNLAYYFVIFTEVLRTYGKKPVKDIALCWLSGVVVPFLLSSLLRLHMMPAGKTLVLIPFIMAFCSDSGAYLIGVKFGKHKMAPVISPKKSWEGFFGGVFSAVIGMVIFAFALNRSQGVSVNYAMAVLYGLLGSMAGVFGDLSTSVIKRQTGIKDYSNLIPGHGGILDRFDSVLMTAPLTEVMLMLLPLVNRL